MTTPATPKPFKKGYKYRLYPNAEQRQFLIETFGANRFLWNHVLDLKKKEYHQCVDAVKEAPERIHQKPNVSEYGLHSLIPGIKAEFDWMKTYSNVTYQQTLTALSNAYSKFLKAPKTVGHPRFKSKRDRQSVTLTKPGFTLKDGQFKPAKMTQPIVVIWSRDLPSEPSSCTLSMTTSGEFYVSFVCEYTPTRTNGTAITGIDFGLKDLVTLSTGEKITNPRHYAKSQKKLKRLQQNLSRCKKGSKNREKARRSLAKHHTHVANQRHDHLHKLSRRLVNESQVLGIETLNIAGMSKNRKLSKHIMTAGWGEFTRQLAYKSAESGHCHLVMIHPYFPSSHLCASTGEHLGRKLNLKERHWQCPHCGETHDRDINAAQVIAQEAVQQLTSVGWPHRPHDGRALAGSKYIPPL